METETATLTAATVATISIPQPDLGDAAEVPNVYAPNTTARQYGGLGSVTVTVLSGTTPVFVSVDGTNPTVAGDDFYALPGVPGASIDISVPDDEDIVVKAISSGTPMVNVTAR